WLSVWQGSPLVRCGSCCRLRWRPGIVGWGPGGPPATRTSAQAAIAVWAMLHQGTNVDGSPTTLSPTQDAIRGSRTAISTRVEPGADALDRLLHIGGRTGVAEAHKMPAVDRIEIDTRRRRHMRLLEEPLGEIETVVGKL